MEKPSLTCSPPLHPHMPSARGSQGCPVMSSSSPDPHTHTLAQGLRVIECLCPSVPSQGHWLPSDSWLQAGSLVFGPLLGSQVFSDYRPKPFSFSLSRLLPF